MKLYYSSVTCALSPLIALLESGAPHEVVDVNLKTKTLDDGTDYRTISPFGFVPLLELDDGRRLGEGVAIIQYIADRAPEKNLAPANETFERYELQGRLNFIATDLVKNYDLLFSSVANDEVKQAAVRALKQHYAWIDGILSEQPFFYGNEFTIADAYLFTVTGWAKLVNLDLSGFRHLHDYLNRLADRPAVAAALEREQKKN
ncbi:MAG: glutathione transferase GstA [Pseudochelatococcus sp.]|uniref:glutathione transferase GstA n=1 Tax=Pseudochelatococcus sp. TaxID=2020869 RepID=UPI003D8FC7FD